MSRFTKFAPFLTSGGSLIREFRDLLTFDIGRTCHPRACPEDPVLRERHKQ
jgi:hypothetical protein